MAAHHIAAVLLPGTAWRHANAGLGRMQALARYAQVAIRCPLHLLVRVIGACSTATLSLTYICLSMSCSTHTDKSFSVLVVQVSPFVSAVGVSLHTAQAGPYE